MTSDDEPAPGRLIDLRLGLQACGPVAAQTAWERYDLLRLWPTWSPQIRAVQAPSPTLTRGLHGRVHGPLGIWIDFTVLSVDCAARRWTWQVRRGPLRLHLEHGVEPAPGGGSRTWLTVIGPAPLVIGYAPVAWWALHRLVSLPRPPA